MEMSKETDKFQGNPLPETEKRIIESEIAKNGAEKTKPNLEAEEVQKRSSQRWYSGRIFVRAVVGGIGASALIAAWMIGYFQPILSKKQELAELNNQIEAANEPKSPGCRQPFSGLRKR